MVDCLRDYNTILKYIGFETIAATSEFLDLPDKVVLMGLIES